MITQLRDVSAGVVGFEAPGRPISWLAVPADADRCGRYAGDGRPPASRNFVKTADPWVENTIR
jgi:hypothetical protein